MTVPRTLSVPGFHRRTAVKVGSIAALLLALVLIPVLGYVQAAGDLPAAKIARTTIQSSRQVAKRTHHKTQSPRVATKATASLGPLETIVQTLNNCGPSSVAASRKHRQLLPLRLARESVRS